MSAKAESKSKRLQELIHRRDKVLAVLHPPTAAHARIMEKAGCEALFVGTGGVVGAYTGLSDVGTATILKQAIEDTLLLRGSRTSRGRPEVRRGASPQLEGGSNPAEAGVAPLPAKFGILLP